MLKYLRMNFEDYASALVEHIKFLSQDYPFESLQQIKSGTSQTRGIVKELEKSNVARIKKDKSSIKICG